MTSTPPTRVYSSSYIKTESEESQKPEDTGESSPTVSLGDFDGLTVKKSHSTNYIVLSYAQ
jgi:hypothetical protein